MSQVVKAIVATDTGDRKVLTKGLSPLFMDVFKAKSEIYELKDVQGVAKVYKFGVQIGSQAMVTDMDYLKGPDALTEAIKRTKRQVIEGIFGEFRQDFRRIEKAIYDYQYEEAGKLLHEMERKMFEEYE